MAANRKTARKTILVPVAGQYKVDFAPSLGCAAYAACEKEISRFNATVSRDQHNELCSILMAGGIADAGRSDRNCVVAADWLEEHGFSRDLAKLAGTSRLFRETTVRVR